MANDSSEMSLEQFEELLIRFGPEIKEWPEMDRKKASNLLESSEDARKLVLFERNVDKLLASQKAPTAPQSLIDRIMSNVKKPD